MSSPVRPARIDAASLTAIRGLLERNLLERAVALSEARWPGSGPVVELAHEWATLSPSARRERLATIGPEELARLRGIAQIQPDLARVMDDLEARGIIPPESPAEVDAGQGVVTATEEPPVTFEEAVADAALDYSEQGLQRLAASAQEDLPPRLEAAMDTETGVALAGAAEAARQRWSDSMIPVPMPDLDLGLPSTGEFLADEAERRVQANQLATAILDRARSRVDAAATRLLPTAESPAQIEAPEPDAPPTTPEPDIAAPRPTDPPPPAAAQQSTRVDLVVDRDLVQRIEHEPVLEFEAGQAAPSARELREAAVATQRDYVDFVPDAMDLRSFYGGLVREGSRITPQAGAFPRAASTRSLVAIHGRLYPKTIERLRAGYCDIPGTQATVRVHPDCRIVVLPQ